MGKILKVKHLKSSDSKKSTAVPKLKTKWEKPKKKYISSQPGTMKIKNVKKRSFDPIKANRGVVLLQNIPHGFYENEMKKYFGQFGLVSRIRLARSEKTGRSKGYAFIEFKVPEVAQIAADTMNNYIMFKHVLKTVYIPPDKQTHNYFRKNVKFATDADGLKSFSSAKTEQIEKEIERINQPRTDEQHAKMLKRIKKSVDQQGKKYGIDLSSIMVSGNNISDESSSTSEEELAEVHIVEEVKKKPNKKVDKEPETKKEEKKLLPKKENKKLLLKKKEDKKMVTRKDEKKVATKKDEKRSEIDKEIEISNGKSLLGELLNSTYDTDTSDDDFKIDHSFSASDDDSSNEENLFDLLAPKLNAAFNQKKSKVFSDIVVNSASESEDESPQTLKMKKLKKATATATNGSVDNSSVNSKKKSVLKRKNKLPSEPITKDPVAASSQSEPEIQIKKKKPNVTKGEITSPTEISSSEPEIGKITKKNKKQKSSVSEVSALNQVIIASEPESANQKKKKKKKHPGDEGINLKAANSSLESGVQKQKMKKKQGDAKVNLNVTTSSSEPEVPYKNIKKNKQKPSGDKENSSKTTTSPSEPEGLNLKSKQQKKNIQATVGQIDNKVTSASQPKTQNLKKKKGKQAANLNATTSSSEAEIQNPKLKNKIASADEEHISITTTNISKSEAVIMKKKKQKVVAPVISTSLTNQNGKAKKDLKRKVKPNLNVSDKADTAAGWTNLSETDGDEIAKPKSKGNLKLKTIVRKNVGKKGSKPNEKDAKKVKLTPADLLQFVPSKSLKKKSK